MIQPRARVKVGSGSGKTTQAHGRRMTWRWPSPSRAPTVVSSPASTWRRSASATSLIFRTWRRFVHVHPEPFLQDAIFISLFLKIHFSVFLQVNRQSQRCRRIQRRADMAYPIVSGPLPVPKGGGVGASGGLTGALLGVGVSGASMGVGSSVYPNGGLPATALGQPCSCQQCMLVLSVKANTGGGIQTLGRRSLTMQRPKNSAPPPSKSLSPSKSATLGRGQQQNANSSYYQTLPHGLAISKNTASQRVNAQLFAQSLAALTAGTSSMRISVSSSRPPPPSLPPPQPPTSNPNPPSVPPKHSSSSASDSVPTATLITPASSVTTPPSPVPTPSPVVMKPQRSASSAATVCHAPLPQRSSLAGLSRPALQRIAMAQSRALIASGWVNETHADGLFWTLAFCLCGARSDQNCTRGWNIKSWL